MRFRFGLETVLKHRKRLEEIAQKEFAEAQAELNICLKEIEGMYQRMDEVREEIQQAVSLGSPQKVAEAREMEQFILGHKIRIERLRLKARELLTVAEDKQEALIAAAQDKKVLVKLREKRLAEYREWLSRMEAKELDDQTMVRESWRRR